MKNFSIKLKHSILCILIVISIFGLMNVVSAHNNQSDLKLNQEKIHHDPLEITSDQQLAQTAQIEGWKGDGSEQNPYKISNYQFDKGMNASELFQAITSSFYYQLGGFSSFNLILVNLSLNVDISYNDFQEAVLVVNSHVFITKNSWVNQDSSPNLFLVGDGYTILNNTFSGSDMSCPNYDYFYPRVFINGYNNSVIHNKFTANTGCSYIIQLAIFAVDQAKSNNYVNRNYIRYNFFEPSNVAISLDGAADLKDVEISNNDFQTGDFAIILHGKDPIISENNFYSAQIGAQGQQVYNGAIKFVTEFYYKPDNLENTVYLSNGISIYNCGAQSNGNHYSDWETPDINGDGVVDTPYTTCRWYIFPSGDRNNTMTSPGNYQSKDVKPYVDSVPAYSAYGKKDTKFYEKPVFIIAATVSIFGILAGLGFKINTYLGNRKAIFKGSLSGPSEKIVKELFKSQTILYYTLIGQSRVEDPTLEQNIKESIPKNFLSYRFLLHPIRLSMVKLLFENMQFTSIQIRNILEISWNEYYAHAEALEKKNYISITEEFIDDSKRSVLRLEPLGAEEYRIITELMHLFLDNTINYQAYINDAQKRMETINRDLYPNS